MALRLDDDLILGREELGSLVGFAVGSVHGPN